MCEKVSIFIVNYESFEYVGVSFVIIMCVFAGERKKKGNSC